jgi:hypothetical protein
MNEDTKPYFQFLPARTDSPTVFKTPAAFLKWAERFSAAWEPTLALDVNVVPGGPMRNSFTTTRDQIRASVAAARQLAESESPETRAQTEKLFRRIFNNRGIPATTEFPEYVAELRASRGDLVAVAAIASLSPTEPNTTLESHLPEYRLGAFATLMFQMGLQTPSNAAVRKLRSEYESAISDSASDKEQFKSAAALALADVASKLQEQLSSDRLEIDAVIAEFVNDGNSAVDSVKSTEKAYLEQMRLQAAVTYWSTEATKHRRSESKIRKWLITYAIGAVLAIVGLLLLLSHFAANSTDLVQYVKYTAIGVLFTTVTIWVGRILLRLFLSERHLSIDAEERVTMVQTYLALTKESKLEPADRPLVLANLFRSGTDGIVKDDGSPDTMLTAILGRVLDKAVR